MSGDAPLLTLAQLREWEARIVEIEEALSSQTVEHALLLKKVEAAKVLMDLGVYQSALVESDVDGAATEAPPAAEAPISTAVLTAVSSIKGSAKAMAIKQWLLENNPSVGARIEANPAYLYTALMRHVRGGRLAKRGKSYRVPTSSPKGETGGVAPPVPVNP